MDVSLVFVVAFTVISTISTYWIYNASTWLIKRTAVCITLFMITCVLVIEIGVHYTRPRDPDLYFGGPEGLVIGIFVLFEYIPTAYELRKEPPEEDGGRTRSCKSCIEWTFAIMGLLICLFSFFFGLTLLGDLEEMANVINSFGLLFVIPTLGVGELVIKCSERRGGEPACGICCCLVLYIPFMILFWYHLDFLSMLSYLTSGIAFFSDIFFGVRRGQLEFKDDLDDPGMGISGAFHSRPQGDVELGENGVLENTEDSTDDEADAASPPTPSSSTRRRTAALGERETAGRRRPRQKRKQKDPTKGSDLDVADDIVKHVTTVTESSEGEMIVTETYHKDGSVTRTVVMDQRKKPNGGNRG